MLQTSIEMTKVDLVDKGFDFEKIILKKPFDMGHFSLNYILNH